jgi:3-methyladenine DNA glycosylase AlkD
VAASSSARSARAARIDVGEVVAWLQKTGTKAVRDGMARFALPSANAFGISVGTMRAKAKQIGTDHALAAALWAHGAYESRMMATFVDDASQVTAAQMERWCRDFDNWGIVDTACFALFDRAPARWAMPPKWAKRSGEFQKRAAFALLWSLSTHDRQASDQAFLDGLKLVESAATDERNFVRKAVNMALRAIGKRNPVLHDASIAVASRLAASDNATARWNGKNALRELGSASVRRRIASRRLRERVALR